MIKPAFSLLSAVLLVLAFPNFNQPWAAWVALVPWLFALQGATPRRAFGWSYLVGLLFFLGSIWWLIHVTVVGWLVLCAYLALSFGVFGWLTHRFTHPPSPIPHPLFLIPSAWVALEYLRTHLLSGFGWNLLGYSQTPWLPIIQMADVTGVWGVSFLVVLANVAIAQALRRRRRGPAIVMVAAAMIAAAWLYGQHRLRDAAPSQPMTVAVIQGNIPQEQKWDDASRDPILERYERLTREAASHYPSLIIWPETSVPGFVGWDPTLTQRLQHLAQEAQAPLLVGTPTVVFDRTARFMNSAVLLGADGALAGRYDKLHLVPFGEFIPFESVMPWLRSVLPPIGDFIPGREPTVFRVDRVPPVSALICFEDLFPDLVRRFVARGAQMLAVITNDAWFGPTAAAYQHAQASTLRAVELRVPVVRAANTGWSGCISDRGRWSDRVHDARGGELFVEGLAACEVAVHAEMTCYRRWGDWFALLCLGVCLGGVIFAIIQRYYPLPFNGLQRTSQQPIR